MIEAQKFAPGEAENRPKVSLEDALQESAGSGLVYKPDLQRLPEEIENKLKDLDEETKTKLEQFEGGGRLMGHLFRLLSPERSEAEHAFAKTILDQYKEASEKYTALLDDEDALREKFDSQRGVEDFNDYAMAVNSVTKIPEGDSSDTVMWWTFAPYLSEELRDRGVGEKEAFERIMDWAIPAAAKEGEGSRTVNLPGLDFLQGEDGNTRTYILSRDAAGASHLFTEQKAKQLVAGHVV